jgi:enoyl-CoA hydratase/carnithine racemase
VPDADLEQATRTLGQTLAGASGTALAFTKQLFYQLDGESLRDGIARGARANAIARATPDFRNAISQFLKK